MDISIIIVNWNVCELLRRCLASIEQNRGDLSLEVIVVDNASTDDSVRMVQQEFPWARIISSPENLGYTGGNNLGAQDIGGRHLFILNPDTEIVSKAMEQMVAYLDEHPAVGAVGPQLLNTDGTVQSSRRRFPQLVTAFTDGAVPHNRRWFPNNRFEQAYFMVDRPDNEIQSVDWLVGAALMIRGKTWQQVGPLDDQFFMYYEELDWCNRCKSAGWEIHYLPTAQVVHHHKGSANQIGSTSRIRLYRSKIQYFRKYYGAGWATIIRIFLLLNYTLVLAEEAIKWTLGHRREKRRQQIISCWQALKTGLW